MAKPLFAWNEPIKLDGGRAQQILQRRINQSVAEYEVFNALETSWGGLCAHVREGWNIGKPPYGYRAKQYRHPNPVKAERGETKSRLEPDGILAETITVAHWRYYERLGYATIVDRLNADPQKYPPLVPPVGATKARGVWSKSVVCEVLRAPRYTDYQAFNRRARRGRSGARNDPALWVWSPEPVHEPLIPKWMYDEPAERRQERRGSRAGNALNTRPQTRRTHVLRACFCRPAIGGCSANTATASPATAVSRGPTTEAAPTRTPATPRPCTYARTPSLKRFQPFARTASSAPSAESCSGRNSVDGRAARQAQAERDRLQRTLDSLSMRQANILRQAETAGPDDPFAKGLRESCNRLESERTAAPTYRRWTQPTPPSPPVRLWRTRTCSTVCPIWHSTL
ncbi:MULTISPECIES: serine integrase family protein [Streptomyces]|uniref:Uncharacterized protein n=1 Tax=Streptomyces coacervatus TaxID=647381 RepID=A0ABP7JD51_9ACTN|nr:recombinase family protein [Streptomyces coacervatus]MDF2264331.1 hypothetical protein [Streptomyces coacervatus]